MLASVSASDVADYFLAFFLLVVGLGLGWALLKLADTFAKTASFIKSSEREVMPVINKVGGSVDRVNNQLDKLDQATDSAVDAVAAVDEVVRALSFSVRRPIEILVGLTSGVQYGFATLRKKRSWRGAVQSAKEASARREADFEQQLRRTGGTGS
jgi:hypothetical protein